MSIRSVTPWSCRILDARVRSMKYKNRTDLKANRETARVHAGYPRLRIIGGDQVVKRAKRRVFRRMIVARASVVE